MAKFFSLFLALASAVHAQVLDPAAFSSLGANPFTISGSYTFNTSGAVPVLTLPNATTINGVILSGIAIFTFDEVSILTGASLAGINNAGSRALALLSKGDFVLSLGASINVSGAGGGGGGPGGGGGAGGNAGPGGGGGGGGGGSGTSAGLGGLGALNGSGGSGSSGGSGAGFGSADPRVSLRGGGGGEGGDGYPQGSPPRSGGGGGGGGGALEIAASGSVTLAGTISAHGGSGGAVGGAGNTGGGGGSGGRVLVAGDTVSLTGSINAAGGSGGLGSFSSGPGGHGGRVVLLTDSGSLSEGSLSQVNVTGATNVFGSSGQNGEKIVAAVPEPGAFTLLGLSSLLCLASRTMARRTRARNPRP